MKNDEFCMLKVSCDFCARILFARKTELTTDEHGFSQMI